MKSHLHNLFNDALSIGVIRTDRIGDMILTLPLCSALKNEFPQKKIILIANSYTKPLLKNCTSIDEVYFINEYNDGIDEIFKKIKIDIAFFPRPKFNECLSAFKYRIPVRIGTAYRWYSFLFNHKLYEHRKESKYHEAEYNVRMLSQLFEKEINFQLIKLYIDFDIKEKIKKIIFDKFGNNNFIIIHPGGAGSAPKWSAENFAKLSEKLIHLNIVITGTDNEIEVCNIVEKSCPNSLNLCGKLNLEEMNSLISISLLMICNSTGVLHIAAALDKPIVSFFPNTPHLSQKRWGPYSTNNIVLNPPNGEDDLNLIEVDKAENAALQLLINTYL